MVLLQQINMILKILLKLMQLFFRLFDFFRVIPSKIITSVIINLFYLYYYATVFFTAILNIIKYCCQTISFSKVRIKIHPHHNVHEGVFKQTNQFASHDGFTLIDYRFETKDKAQVHLWRLNKQNKSEDHPYPIIIMHGLLQSSSTWFLTEKKINSLPYLLASRGYDVWIGNNRGNRIAYQQNLPYKNYNIDHLVQFDQPAIIQGVLTQSKKEKVLYLGHSQGSTQMMLALGVHPWMKDKIAGFIGMGSIISLSKVEKNKVLGVMQRYRMMEILNFIGFNKLLLVPWEVSKALGVVISNCVTLTKVVVHGMKLLVGFTCANKVPDHTWEVIFTHQPGGGSVNNVLHWVQCYRQGGRLRKFCYGAKKNLQLYGNEISPEYCLTQLKNLNFKSYLFRGEKDSLVSQKDFKNLIQLFDKERVQQFVMHDYNHLDYLWSSTAHLDFYPRIVQIIENQSRANSYSTTSI